MNLFFTPTQSFVVVNNDLSNALDDSGICDFLEENKTWNCSVETSYFNSEQQNAANIVKQSLDASIMPFAINYIKPLVDKNCEVSLQDVWVNRYKNGGFQERHIHAGSEVSFVYMHKTTERHSALRFHNPICDHLEQIKQRTGVLFNPIEYDVFLEPGQVIFFPSHLPHSVAPKKAEGERVTLSGNIKVRSIET